MRESVVVAGERCDALTTRAGGLLAERALALVSSVLKGASIVVKTSAAVQNVSARSSHTAAYRQMSRAMSTQAFVVVRRLLCIPLAGPSRAETSFDALQESAHYSFGTVAPVKRFALMRMQAHGRANATIRMCARAFVTFLMMDGVSS
eukprot:2227938-Pleurochrysis_carterae.AAC.6